jgi:integrative and conjugative element protein (TIGR02256 family)
LRLDERKLSEGVLLYWGEILIRPPGGTRRQPILLLYPHSFPFESPSITPLKSLPLFDQLGAASKVEPEYFDRRHQMPNGNLCLFQRETRIDTDLAHIDGLTTLRRAKKWFLGHYTGRWPPDSAESELEPHFLYAGDVLLSQIFYSPSITQHGRFWTVPDLNRSIDQLREDCCPRIVTAITSASASSEVEGVLDARQDIAKIYPWIKDAAFNPLNIEHSETEHGYWWALDKEPTPFHDGAGFLRVLSAVAPNGDSWALVSQTLRTELSLASAHLFALKYPGRNGEPEWLVLYMPRIRPATPVLGLVQPGSRVGSATMNVVDLGKSDAQKRQEFEASPVFCLRSHGVRPQDLRLRNTGIFTSELQSRTLALLGLGALGSAVAELLAKAGVGKFILCDSDRLAPGNVVRHVGRIQDFGATKTRVVASRILSINPYIQFVGHHASVTNSLSCLVKLIEPADLTVVTTADEAVESVINQIAVITKKRVVYGRALRRADVGRVFLVRPGIDACKACLGLYSRAGLNGGPVPSHWIRVDERPEDILLHECGRPVIPASAVDLAFIAALIARTALDFLEGKPVEKNHFLWTRIGSPDIDKRLADPMTTFEGFLGPSPACTVCREPEVNKIHISENAQATMIRLAEQDPTAETGGILIGWVDSNGTATVIKATEPGTNAKRSPRLFVRDTQFAQREIEEAARQFGPKGAYVGEWHSHLEADPSPSPLDLESMVGIARAQNYLTRCPIMVIAGVDPGSRKVTAVRSWSVPLGGSLYQVENRTIPGDGMQEVADRV